MGLLLDRCNTELNSVLFMFLSYYKVISYTFFKHLLSYCTSRVLPYWIKYFFTQVFILLLLYCKVIADILNNILYYTCFYPSYFMSNIRAGALTEMWNILSHNKTCFEQVSGLWYRAVFIIRRFRISKRIVSKHYNKINLN